MNASVVAGLIDTHVHFWDPQGLRYPWLAAVPALNRTYTPKDYDAASTASGIAKFIFVECDCDPAQNLEEVAWVSAFARTESRLGGIIAHAAVETGASVRPHLARLRQNPLVKGVRRNLQGEADPNFCLQTEFVSGVAALEEFGFTFDLCVRPAQLPAITELARRCARIPFVLDHCGKPEIRQGRLDPWRRHLHELAALPNVVCKISGLVTEAAASRLGAEHLRPYVEHAIACFGWDRVLFGGDWPVCNLATHFSGWTDTLGEILATASPSNLRQLYQSNAERIYHV
jgi:L-fuconolactonase